MKLVGRIILMLSACIFFLPVLLTVAGAFLSELNISIYSYVTIRQFYSLLIENFKYLSMFWNSVLLSSLITIGNLVISLLTAYVFAKINFKFRDKLFFVYVVIMMMPFQVTLLPMYIMARWMKLYDTYWAIILPGIFAPFGVFLLRQFIKFIPDELFEAFSLESTSIIQKISQVIVPSIKPGVIACCILTFAENWNMVEQPIVLLSNKMKYPLSIALNSVIEHAPDTAFAGSLIYMIPILLLFLYFKENIIEGH